MEFARSACKQFHNEMKDAEREMALTLSPGDPLSPEQSLVLSAGRVQYATLLSSLAEACKALSTIYKKSNLEHYNLRGAVPQLRKKRKAVDAAASEEEEEAPPDAEADQAAPAGPHSRAPAAVWTPADLKTLVPQVMHCKS